MILIALIVCIIMSTGSFAWGYWQADYEELTRWILLFGIFWLIAQWRKWRWFNGYTVFIGLFLAAYGVWFMFGYGWMFNGAVFAIFAWNLSEFEQKLRLMSVREDKIGISRRRVIRIGLLALGSLCITALLLLWNK